MPDLSSDIQYKERIKTLFITTFLNIVIYRQSRDVGELKNVFGETELNPNYVPSNFFEPIKQCVSLCMIFLETSPLNDGVRIGGENTSPAQDT